MLNNLMIVPKWVDIAERIVLTVAYLYLFGDVGVMDMLIGLYLISEA